MAFDWKELGVALVRIIYSYVESLLFLLVPNSMLPHKKLSGEIALITGAGSGIGRLVALRLARLGTRLVLWDINDAGLQETARLVRQENATVDTYVCDVSNRERIYEVADRVREDVGHVTLLINNAGIVSGSWFLETPDQKIQKTMDVNINAHFWTLKAFLPHMVEENRGHIVTISSMASKSPTPRLVDYCTSKFAATGLHESLAMELRTLKKDGIHLTNICPFFINTGMFEGATIEPWVQAIMPLMEPDYVADKIVEGIQLNKYEVLLPPSMIGLMYLKTFFPRKACEAMEDFFRVPDFMANFVGREGSQRRK